MWSAVDRVTRPEHVYTGDRDHKSLGHHTPTQVRKPDPANPTAPRCPLPGGSLHPGVCDNRPIILQPSPVFACADF